LFLKQYSISSQTQLNQPNKKQKRAEKQKNKTQKIERNIIEWAMGENDAAILLLAAGALPCGAARLCLWWR
jgi:hypothetical protein